MPGKLWGIYSDAEPDYLGHVFVGNRISQSIHLTLLEPYSRLGDSFTLNPSNLSSKRDCGSETDWVNSTLQG